MGSDSDKKGSGASAIIGIIPNPASGKDIRRIVTHALVMGNQEKVNLVRRLLVGLHASGVQDVRIMPDRFGIGEQAIAGLQRHHGEVTSGVSILEMDVSGTELDTIHAAQVFAEHDAACIITLGGDGTARLVGNHCGEVPILPISTGTNNVLPRFVDGTVAGLSAGFFIRQAGAARLELCTRSKRLDVEVNGEVVDTALVDVAAVEGAFVGSRAVWEAEAIRQIFVTRASPTSIGLSAVVGMVHPITVQEPFGAVITLAPNGTSRSVMAAIGPGLVSDIPYEDVVLLQPGMRHPVSDARPLTLALDGEREVVLQADDVAAVVLNENGPWVVDVDAVMQRAVHNEFFTRK
jgi:predicted polyphosphate/ATP-dependent NAD kinase